MKIAGTFSTKAAAAHEGTNFAAVQKVPAIFILQNNQVALGTRLDQHHLPGHFKDWPAQYGIWGAEFDGNNVLMRRGTGVCRHPRPSRGRTCAHTSDGRR